MKRLTAPLLVVSWLGVACGANVVFVEDGGASSTSAGGSISIGGAGSGAGAAGGEGEGGCDPASHTINPADYDRSCNDVSDCVAVYLGDFCQFCSCPFSAINVADKSKYDAESQVKESGTPPDTCSCPFAPTVCEGGECATHTP